MIIVDHAVGSQSSIWWLYYVYGYHGRVLYIPYAYVHVSLRPRARQIHRHTGNFPVSPICVHHTPTAGRSGAIMLWIRMPGVLELASQERVQILPVPRTFWPVYEITGYRAMHTGTGVFPSIHMDGSHSSGARQAPGDSSWLELLHPHQAQPRVSCGLSTRIHGHVIESRGRT